MRAFLLDESGTETVEWGIMAGIIVVGLVTLVISIGNWVSGKFTQLDNDLKLAP